MTLFYIIYHSPPNIGCKTKFKKKSKVKGGVHNKRGRQVKFASQTWVPKIFSNKDEKKRGLIAFFNKPQRKIYYPAKNLHYQSNLIVHTPP